MKKITELIKWQSLYNFFISCREQTIIRSATIDASCQRKCNKSMSSSLRCVRSSSRKEESSRVI